MLSQTDVDISTDVEAAWLDWLAPYGAGDGSDGEPAIPLDLAAARVAAEEGGAGGGADLRRVCTSLDHLAAPLARARGASPVEQVARLVQHLFGELGFRGDTDTYTDPRNSCIDQVIARRRGLPILLSLLAIEVARRFDLRLLPVGFPGHFLVSTEAEPRVYLDPFHQGRIRPTAELSTELERWLGRPPTPDELRRMLEPILPRDLLVRMSTNLIRAWLERGRSRDALRNADRRVALRPDLPELRRDRGLLRARVGQRDGAAMDIGAYLAERPAAEDAVKLRWQLSLLLG